MSAVLTDNLPLLAGAPNGIKKLRELILELAVRGKLVPQDANDEPASELLKRIAEEKARLVADGKIKRQKLPAEIGEEQTPFEVPANWAWARLGELGLVGSSSRVHQKDWRTSGVPFYRAREIVRLSKDGFVENDLFISEELYQDLSSGESAPKAGDIMLTGVGTIGVPYCVRETDRFYFKDASVLIFKKYLVDKSSYLLKYFVSPLWVEKIHAESMGTTVHTLTIARANETLCPLPPLAEQHRIVAKVDELMAMCDRLEARQADADSAHAQLVQALLGSLTQACDAGDFAQSWQRLAEHFHTLFTTGSSIDALKQSLLQLAVIGKLVPQDSSDEHASELLKRVSEEKARLVAEGKLKKQKPLGDVAISDIPFDVPDNWAWSRIGEIALNTEYGLSEKTFDLQDGVPVLKMGDIQEGRVLLGGQMVVSKNTEGLPELYLETEDLLYNRTNSAELVGKTGVFLGQAGEYSFASYLIRIRCLKELFSPLYLNISMNAPGFRETQINPHLKQQCGQANVNGTIMKNMLVSVPPLPEQHRIVAKVDQLMALCEQLKTRLNQAQQVHEHLASALVEQAVA